MAALRASRNHELHSTKLTALDNDDWDSRTCIESSVGKFFRFRKKQCRSALVSSKWDKSGILSVLRKMSPKKQLGNTSRSKLSRLRTTQPFGVALLAARSLNLPLVLR